MIMKPLQYVLYVDYDYGVYLCNMDFVTTFFEILAAILYVRTVSVISARNIFAIGNGFYVCAIDLLDTS
jgi:hypothetical protein